MKAVSELGVRRLATVLLWSLAVGCETVPPESAMEDGIQTGGLERWECGDFTEGCGFLRERPVKLTADFDDRSGTVEFAGTVNYTRFEIRGLTRRWDWCPQDGAFDCALVIDTEGDGTYCDFRSAMPDADGARRTEPSELFK